MTQFGASDLRDFGRLLARSTAARKTGLARRSAEASQLNIAVGYRIARSMRAERMQEFYRRRFPLVGGLSSVNMTPGWAGDAHPSPVSAYHRVSPTGPMLPLVLTPTTLGQNLRVCCTFKPALMSEHRAGQLVDAFFEKLQAFAG